MFFTKGASAVEFQGKFIQGHFIIGKTKPGTKVLIDKKDTTEKKIYLKAAINNKFISKSLTVKKNDLEKIELNEKVISFTINYIPN